MGTGTLYIMPGDQAKALRRLRRWAMKRFMHEPLQRLRRSVLYVPANNERALAKSATLSCDAIIFDLEDAVSPDTKGEAREQLRAFLQSTSRPKCEIVIRINPLAGEWGTEDFLTARACHPDAILLPKVEGPRDILDADAALDETDAPRSIRLWAMIETPRGLLNAGSIAELGRDPAARLSCLVAGTNDLVKETRVASRDYLTPWLLQIVLAARAGNLTALDGVWNAFRDTEAFARECARARAMGFDGKTLIHPKTIPVANRIFAPSAEEVAWSRRIIEAHAAATAEGKGVVVVDGKLVENLHVENARRIVALAEQIAAREADSPKQA